MKKNYQSLPPFDFENGEYYLKIKEFTIRVRGILNFDDPDIFEREFEEGAGYIDEHSQIVWIYVAARPTVNINLLPYFWRADGEIKHSVPYDDVMEMSDVSHVVNRSISYLMKHTTGPDTETDDEYVRNLLMSSAGMTLPILKFYDDFLKKTVKAAMIHKKQSTTTIPKANHLIRNMITALLNTTKTSTKYYDIWKDVLHFDFRIDVTDDRFIKGEKLPFPIWYDSEFNSIFYNDPETGEVRNLAEDPLPEVDFKLYALEPDDNFLMMVVKAILILKKIDAKSFPKDNAVKHLISYMVYALKNKATMSTTHFIYWVEALEFGFTITLRNSKSPELTRPMPSPLKYVLQKDMIYYQNPETGEWDPDPDLTDQFGKLAEDVTKERTRILEPEDEEDDEDEGGE